MCGLNFFPSYLELALLNFKEKMSLTSTNILQRRYVNSHIKYFKYMINRILHTKIHIIYHMYVFKAAFIRIVLQS